MCVWVWKRTKRKFKHPETSGAETAQSGFEISCKESYERLRLLFVMLLFNAQINKKHIYQLPFDRARRVFSLPNTLQFSIMPATKSIAIKWKA
jgi:hypothetical protein